MSQRAQLDSQPQMKTSSMETRRRSKAPKTLRGIEDDVQKERATLQSPIRKLCSRSVPLLADTKHWNEIGPPRKRRSNRVSTGALYESGMLSKNRAPDLLRVISSGLRVVKEGFFDAGVVHLDSDGEAVDHAAERKTWSGSSTYDDSDARRGSGRALSPGK